MDSHQKDDGWWKKMELQVKICYNERARVDMLA